MQHLIVYMLGMFCSASAKAFDEYGELTKRFEKQQELKDKAESLATDVSIVSYFLALTQTVHIVYLLQNPYVRGYSTVDI